MAADSIADIDERIMQRGIADAAHGRFFDLAGARIGTGIGRRISSACTSHAPSSNWWNSSEVIQRALAEDRLMITGARYQLDTGKVEVLSF